MKTNLSIGRLLTNVLVCATITGSFLEAGAKEGMWLPPSVKSREADMKSMGLEIPAEMLYNNEGTGLNNAVVLFGRGCTGEIISGEGLLLTNHHCGYSSVQALSSPQHDYFAAGFWAMNKEQELPCPGLTVTFIRKTENVTDKILGGLDDTLRESLRDSMIALRVKNLEKGYKYISKMDASIRPFFNGNQYWVILSETFRDVRLVGFPPNGIGSFGGDTDNWMWPRHTGDFSMFRVYAGADNRPADYAPGNKPYRTKNYFTINAKGYKEGDFTMVYGFPGTTQEYISSYQLNQIYSISDPIRIEVRTRRLAAWTAGMTDSREVFIKYTSKRAGVANGWKKWQGELRGLRINDVINNKRMVEKNFQQWAAGSNAPGYVKDLLLNIQAYTSGTDDLLKTEEYIREAVLGIEIVQQGALLDKMLQQMRKGQSLTALKAEWNDFYKNYDAATDEQVFLQLMPLYFEKCANRLPAAFTQMYKEQGSDFTALARYVYRFSAIPYPDKTEALTASAGTADSNKILADPAWQLYHAITTMRQQQILPGLAAFNERMRRMNRLYMQAQMLREPDRQFYPDANLTLRLTYGKIQGIRPDGTDVYSFQTNLDEAVRKDNPEVEEFTMPARLKELFRTRNYGRWGVNGTVPIAFLASNHTSGGNSGSPVLNAKGELIGTNFDRIWEGTMSDLYFDPNLCRNISVDIRYTLFIVEKFGGAGWLLKEMKFAR